MQRREGEFTGELGTRIWYQVWLPEAGLVERAVVLVVHGIGEHSGRYGNVVDTLVPRGYVLYGLDHRGHGRSGGARGHVTSFDEYVADVKRLFDLARAENPGLPIYVLGHSMGGAIALQYALQHPDGLAGVIASAPGLRAAFAPPKIQLALARFMSRVAPSFSQKTGLPATGLSHDQQVVAAYQNDPLVHGFVSARWYTEFVRAGQEVLDRAREINLPCLFMQGTADPLVDARATEQCFHDVSSTDKTLRLYDGFLHESFNEVERERPLQDLLAWLDAHTTPAQKAG